LTGELERLLYADTYFSFGSTPPVSLLLGSPRGES